MRKILSQKFFNRPTLEVAQDLLGTFLVRKYPSTKLGTGRGKEIAVMITEVEAYDGPRDKASHAHKSRTKRNEVMFGEAGRWYVYFVYGIYWMLNIVTGAENYPAAILIRGGIVTKHVAYNAKHKSKKGKKENRYALHDSRYMILNGPGKLTKFLHINRKSNGCVANKRSNLWIEDRGLKIEKTLIKRSKRIGVEYAKEWTGKPYRFYIKN